MITPEVIVIAIERIDVTIRLIVVDVAVVLVGIYLLLHVVMMAYYDVVLNGCFFLCVGWDMTMMGQNQIERMVRRWYGVNGNTTMWKSTSSSAFCFAEGAKSNPSRTLNNSTTERNAKPIPPPIARHRIQQHHFPLTVCNLLVLASTQVFCSSSLSILLFTRCREHAHHLTMIAEMDFSFFIFHRCCTGTTSCCLLFWVGFRRRPDVKIPLAAKYVGSSL